MLQKARVHPAIREKAAIAVLLPEIAWVLPGTQTARVTAWNKKFLGNLC
jgi:hypothetical protein